MALLKFKKGSFKQLPSTKTEGTVYITSDTREMYVDINASTRISISGLRIVSNEAALTALGAEGGEGYSTEILYFVEDTKALKKYNGTDFDYLNDTSDLAELGKTVAAHTTSIANLNAKDDELEEAIGNINASNVDTTQKIIVTKAVGNYAAGKEIDINTSVQDLLLNMLSEDIKASVTTPVSASLTLSNNGAKEVGSVFTPSYSFSTNAGAYSQYRDSATGSLKNQPTNVEFNTFSATESNRPDGAEAETLTTKSGSFTKFTITDALTSATPYKITGSCKSTAGAVPKTYLGIDDTEHQIQAQEWKDLSSSTVYGYRSWFYGYKTATTKLDVSKLSSAQMRALTAKNGTLVNQLTTNGMQQMFFAIPATAKINNKDITNVAVANAVNGAPCTVSKTTVQIEGANGYQAVAYNVWYVDNASADSGSNTYKITVS